MRNRKSLLIVLLLSFGLTGCYTQLEYTQKVKRITDEKPVEGYSWSDESEERANLTKADSIYIAQTYGAKVAPYREEEPAEYEDEYIPVEYKNYDVIEEYEACGCDPYKSYVIYNSYYHPTSSWYYDGWYGHPYYGHYAYFSPFYRWHWRHHFGFGYYHRGFGLAFHWGSPYYYYDPFFYDPFYYGYRSPFFGGYYYGGFYKGTIASRKSDRRYGRRSIGTDRVRDRNSTTIRTRSGITRDKANTTRVRGRTTGVTRSRGTIQRTRGSRVGSSNGNRTSGTRSRGTVKRSRSNDNTNNERSRGSSQIKRNRGNSNNQAVIPRTGLGTGRDAILPSSTNRREIESRIRQQRIERINYGQQRSRRSFLGRFKSIFDTDRVINSSGSRNTTRSFDFPNRTRSKFGRSNSRSRSSSGGTKVRSRSSSSKSSGSRSRSSSSRSSSSKKRSRGNN